MAIRIASEDDLFRILEDLENGEQVEPDDILFDGWPKYEVIIRGEDFKGGVPTRIMPALLSLQRSIDQAYALSVYGEQRRLSSDERRRTEIIVHLEKGSTKFEAPLWDILNNALTAAANNMNGTQSLAAILGVAAILGGGWYLKLWLEAKSRDKKAEYDANASKEETERFRLVVELAQQNAQLAGAKTAFEETNKQLINRLEDSDSLVLDSDAAISGSEARAIVRKLPDAPVEVRLDGDYRILSVQSGAVKSGFKATIENVKTGEKLAIDIPEGTLTPEQLASLQHGEWEKATLYMRINASKRGEKILKATLTHAGLDSREP